MRHRRNGDWKPIQPRLHGRMNHEARERRLEAEEDFAPARYADSREGELAPGRGRRRNGAFAACSGARTLEQLVRALRSLRPSEVERFMADRPTLPTWGAKPKFVADDVLSWDTRNPDVQLLVTYRRTPGGRVIFSQREEWSDAPHTAKARWRPADAFEDVLDEPLFNGRGGRRARGDRSRARGDRSGPESKRVERVELERFELPGGGAAAPPFPCTRCGALVATLEDMRRTCPTPSEPYTRLPPEERRKVGHSLPPRQYFQIQYGD